MAGNITETGYAIQAAETIAELLISSIEAQTGFDFSREAGAMVKNFYDQHGEREALIQEKMRDVINALDPRTSTGKRIDDLAALRGVSPRKLALRSTIPGIVRGTPGTIIPAGTNLQYENGTAWRTLTTVTLPAATGFIAVNAESVEFGAIEAFLDGPDAWTVNDVIAGLDSFESTADADLGQLREGDPTFRKRSDDSVASPSVGVIASLKAEILAVNGVTDVNIVSNRTNVAKDGVPGGAMAITVDALDSPAIRTAVAEAIGRKIQPGQMLHGDVGVNVDLGENNVVELRFSFRTDVPIFIRATLRISTSVTAYTESQTIPIRETLVEYGNTYSSDVGQDVLGWQFAGAIGDPDRAFVGIDLATVEVSTDNVTFADKVTIGPTQRADYSLANVGLVFT